MNKREFANRIAVLDTEMTGLNPQEGHLAIEIGCVELVKRRLTGNRFHVYINPIVLLVLMFLNHAETLWTGQHAPSG